ncbi:elongation of very long chain fatty acids protein AAEL008004-like [Adelges cooleyi]|uniref:elongation of very long chain fatty acids protein AAEL008004-like n=1 Tax=Adelges cooleyi TaxID=133065 RepID=UPI0021808FC7|nr:elongation of very long chain fatty acids protein AAEL008004-like [Adelges cooleyi]
MDSNDYSVVNEAHQQILHLLKKELKSDKVIDSWVFMSSPWPITLILLIYLAFILKIGPEFMKNREPFSIKNVMLLYNLMQTIFNGYLLAYVFITPGLPTYIWNHTCQPDQSGTKTHIKQEFHTISWYFVLSKIVDLFDTVFFVLRKKQSHVSFLHVYHHVNMVITCYVHLRFIKSEQAAFGGVINSFIHVIMYLYYFLAALGPHMQKHLWWKKYLTGIQIVQFILNIIYLLGLYAFDCNYPKLFLFYMLADIILFLYMFLKFYNNTYNIKNKSQ